MSKKRLIYTFGFSVALIIIVSSFAFVVFSKGGGSFSGKQTATVIGRNVTPAPDTPTGVTIDLIYVVIAIAVGLFAILGVNLRDIIKGLSWRRRYGKSRTPVVMPSRCKK